MTDVASERGKGQWRKGSRSHAAGDCVEMVDLRDAVGVRDSKQPETVLHLTRPQWRDFLEAVKHGEFDRRRR